MARYNDPPPRSFLKWAGGKREVLPEILRAVAAAGPFGRYHEPFLGGGAVFFALARAQDLRGRAMLGDINPNLMDAYLGVRDEVEEVITALTIHQRRHCEAYYYDIRGAAPKRLGARAARVIYLNRTCYNGLYRENSKGLFNVPCGRYRNPTICDAENLRAVAETLQHVDLAARDFTRVLEASAPGDLVYFDPPYVPLSKSAGFTSYARDGFGAEEQRELARVFAELARRGVKVMLSNSVTDFTRELYPGFDWYQVLARRSVNSRADRRGPICEALITNFPIATTSRRAVRAGRNGARQPTLLHQAVEEKSAHQWLVDNTYGDIAALIDEITTEWKTQGKRTRRNWWAVLAGDRRGRPCVVAGRKFPVLRIAQLRQGVPLSDDALPDPAR